MAQFFGGGTDEQKDFYAAAAATGRTAADVITKGYITHVAPEATTASLVVPAATWTNVPELITTSFVMPPGLVRASTPAALTVHSAGGHLTNDRLGLRYRINGTGSWHLAASAAPSSFSGGLATWNPLVAFIPTISATATDPEPYDDIEIAWAHYSAAGTTLTVQVSDTTTNGIWPHIWVEAP
jgi:hypothetical protein